MAVQVCREFSQAPGPGGFCRRVSSLRVFTTIYILDLALGLHCIQARACCIFAALASTIIRR